jgi:hypothetical protein
MKFIDNKLHGVLDYVTVIAFALIPTVFGLTGIPAYLSYVLAVVHFLMTVFTRFEFGIVKALPLKFHKLVETAVGPILVVIPWILGFSDDVTARFVYIAMGVVIILVGVFSKYRGI